MNSLKLKIPKKTLDVQVTTVDAVLEFQIDVSGIQSSWLIISLPNMRDTCLEMHCNKLTSSEHKLYVATMIKI